MGIVYHSNYFIWFEVARSDFFKSIGYSYSKLEDENIILPVTEVKCEYFKPARYDQNVRVETSINLFKGVRFGLYYEIYDDQTGDLLAKGHTLHGFVNKELKPVNIKKKNPEVYAIISKAMEEEDNGEEKTR
jgi:acyl-CoA thioester hydrolase